MTLHWESAVRAGNAMSIREQLDRGADANARDRHGQTALMLAAHAGHRDVVAILIERGADLDVTAKYRLSALMLAVISGHPEIARQLAHAGADLSQTGTGTPDFSGQTAHDLALARGLTDLAADLMPRK